jgi:hypothetical protein
MQSESFDSANNGGSRTSTAGNPGDVEHQGIMLHVGRVPWIRWWVGCERGE